jgi:hypothetical protein
LEYIHAIWLAWGISILSISFIVAFIAIFSNQETVYGLPNGVQYVFLLPWVIGPVSAAMAAFTVIAWLRRYWNRAGRIYFTFVTVETLAFVWWLYYWNMFTFRV